MGGTLQRLCSIQLAVPLRGAGGSRDGSSFFSLNVNFYYEYFFSLECRLITMNVN